MKILLYGNGASGNHGCEAIVRGTTALLGTENNSYIVLSDNREQDESYGLGELAEIRNAQNGISKDFRFLSAYAKMKLAHNYAVLDELYYDEQIRAAAGQVDCALSVGGDNYCYGGTDLYAELNKAYHRAGIKTVLWGCSIEPAVVETKKVQRDLQRYNRIVARESITYEAIKQVQPNTVLAPDPAFFMEAVPCRLDERFQTHEMVGINLSPMIISNERSKGLTLENYKNLVQYILEHTEYDVALIPHVVWPQNDDRQALAKLYEAIEAKDRLIVVDDMTAPELKYCISHCKLFVGARTHATIAAYSSGVPTLVVGYSVKARGIAKDLFGDDQHYVLPVQSLSKPEELSEAFRWIEGREKEIRNHLHDFLPEYVKRGEFAISALKDL